jgi:hypothetical protein
VNPDQTIYTKLFKVICTLAGAWQKPFYHQLSKAKNMEEFVEAREQSVKRSSEMHVI